jgi:hypothetical protein
MKGILTQEDAERVLLRSSSREQAMLLLSLVEKGNDYTELFSILKKEEEHWPHHKLGEDLEEIHYGKSMQA